jgi:hypothetical protein
MFSANKMRSLCHGAQFATNKFQGELQWEMPFVDLCGFRSLISIYINGNEKTGMLRMMTLKKEATRLGTSVTPSSLYSCDQIE